MPGEKKTHEENLASVCCVCGRKGGKFQNVSQKLAEKVVKQFQPSYNRQGGVHPTAICDTCRKACTEMEKKPEQTRHRVPNLLDYSAIKPPGVTTRGNSDCSCSFCDLGSLSVRDEKQHNKQISNPVGRPAGEVEKETDATPNLNISIKTCDYCKAEMRQGVKHVCNLTERRRNMANQLKTASSGTLETVAGAALKEVERRQELASPDGSPSMNREISLQSGFGGASPLSVTIGGKRKQNQLTTDDLLNMRKLLGLSSVKTKELAHLIRVGQKNRKAVESGLAKALVDSNNRLDDLFTSEEIQVENKKGEMVKKTLVYCNDVCQLVIRLLEH